MSDKSCYETLGVDESSSFDEIQEARNRLIQECKGQRKQQEAIESAYDAILMDRLRMRQEGKIKVPERIRFPERLVEPPAEVSPPLQQKAPDWMQHFLDTPSRADVLLPAGLFVALGALSFFTSPALPLALGVGFSLYFISRKERKFGRAFLLTLVGLIVGVILGVQIGSLLTSQAIGLPLPQDAVAALVTFLLLWLISSFLR